MASVTSAVGLLGALSGLAFTLSQMANGPLLPFLPENTAKLRSESRVCVSAAGTLHDGDAGVLDQAAVDSATMHVQAAQHLFDIINQTATNQFTAAGVFATVDSAIAAVQAALPASPSAGLGAPVAA